MSRRCDSRVPALAGSHHAVQDGQHLAHARRMLAAYRERGAAALAHCTGGAVPTTPLRPERPLRWCNWRQSATRAPRTLTSPSCSASEKALTSAGPRCVAFSPRRASAVITPGWRTEGPNSPCCWPWTTPPVPWSTPCFCTGETTAGYFTLLEGLIEERGIPPRAVQRPPRGIQAQRPPAGDCGGSHPVHPVPAGTGDPTDLRPLATGQGPCGTRGGNLPGPARNRTAPGRCQDHRLGHGGAAGLPAPLQRPLLRSG